MFLFVASDSTGTDSPAIVTLASTGSYAGCLIGRRSTRYVSGPADFEAPSST